MHVDLRVGGRYELVMIDRQNDTRYPLRYEIIELVVPDSSCSAAPPCRRWACPTTFSRAWSSTTMETRRA